MLAVIVRETRRRRKKEKTLLFAQYVPDAGEGRGGKIQSRAVASSRLVLSGGGGDRWVMAGACEMLRGERQGRLKEEGPGRWGRCAA